MDVKSIKSQLKISSVLNHYGTEKGPSEGSWWCPIHEAGGKASGHKTPSLVAKDSSGIATCLSRSCFENDDIFGVIAKMENLDLKTNFPEIVSKAKDIGNIFSSAEQTSDKPMPVKKHPAKIYPLISPDKLQENHYEYLQQIGINEDTANLFGLKSISRTYARNNNLKNFEEFILYPQKANREIIGWKAISTKKNEQGKKKSFFNHEKTDIWGKDLFKDQKHLVLVEGEKDCLRINQEILAAQLDNLFGITFVTGSQGVPNSFTNWLESSKIESLTIIYDNDDAGKKGIKHILKEISELKNLDIKIIAFPENKAKGYDVSDWFDESLSLEELLSLPQYSPFEYLFRNRLITSDFIEESLIPDKILKTGVDQIDSICPIVFGQNTIITGRTGGGKTVLASNMVNWVIEENLDAKVLVFSLELRKKSLFHRLISAKYDIEKWKIEKGFQGSDGTIFKTAKDKFIEKANSYKNKFGNRLLIYDDLYSVEEFDAVFTELSKHNFSPSMVVVDYANVVDMDIGPDSRKESKFIEISKYFTRLAKTENMHIMVLCQANRLTTEKADGFARTENLADSDQFGRDAFIVYSVKNDDENFYINPTKNRNGKAESIIKLPWNASTGRVYAIDDQQLGQL